MTNIKMINADEFDKEVLQATLPCMAYFGATWCRPCSVQFPIVEDLAKDLEGQAVFVKVDIDDSHELANTYKIKSIPAMLVFNGGQVINTQIGSTTKANLLKMFPAKE